MTDIREDLKAHLDGELDPARRAEVERALAESAELREESAFLASLSGQIRRQARAPQTADTPAGLLQARRPFWRRQAMWVPAAGLMAVAALAVFIVPRLSGRMNPESMAPASGAAAMTATAFAEPRAGEAPAQDLAKAEAGADERARMLPDPEVRVLIEPNRQIIRTGSIALEVEKLVPMVSVIEGLAAGAGGYVESSSQNAGGDAKTANLTIRVRSSSFGGVMDQLRQLGRVVSESSSGEDVTLQISDLQARVRALRAEEESLLQILRSARRTSEILEVRDRLSRIRMEIESMDSQRAALAGLAAMSTITVGLEEKDQIDPASPGDAASGAWTAALNALSAAWQGLVVVLIWALVFAPIWLPIGLAAWWLSRRRAKRG